MSVFLYYVISLSLSQTAPDKDTCGQNEKYYMHEVLHALIWKKKDLTIRNWFLCSTTILFERLKLFLSVNGKKQTTTLIAVGTINDFKYTPVQIEL